MLARIITLPIEAGAALQETLGILDDHHEAEDPYRSASLNLKILEAWDETEWTSLKAFDREISFLSAAAAAGLDTIGYVRNRDEASKMAAAGLTSLCINFSLNPPKREASIDEKILQ